MGSHRLAQSDEESAPQDRAVAFWAIPLIAAALTPGLVWAVANDPLPARMDYVVVMTAAVLIIAVLIAAVLSRGFTRRVRWALSVASVVVLMLFHWPALTYVGRNMASATGMRLLSDVVPVAIAVAAIAIATRLGNDFAFAALIGASAVVAVIVLALAAAPLKATGHLSARGQAAADAPDVVLLVLDGYTRSDILRNDFAFDNAPFEDELRRRGFSVANRANANYNITYASLSSMLNLDYVLDVGDISSDEKKAVRVGLAGDPAMLQVFREAGYEIAFVENSWAGSYCGAAVDRCWRDGVAERIIWNLGQTSIFAPLIARARPHPFSTLSESDLEALPEIVSADRVDGTPRLTVAHIILPHPPYLLDENCDRLPVDPRRSILPWADNIESRRGYYSQQVVCTNTMVLESLDRILEDRSDTVVMITADHGSDTAVTSSVPPEEWPAEWVHERLSIFSAYRLPGCGADVYPTITPVNGTRMVTNCALDTEFELLEDRRMMVPDGYRGTVFDASSLLAAAEER
ncbi:MAG: sulfatase-like hydrolase/transferase [Acidimicrobiia bacterium]|nr:sulfatase-like hydrolase/transferase [Acidimicrobiia bacterium]